LVNCVVNQQVLQAMAHTHTADLSPLINFMNSGFVRTLLNAYIHSVSRSVKDIKIHQDFPQLWSQI